MTTFTAMTAEQHIAAADRHLETALTLKGNDDFVRPKLSMALMALSMLGEKPGVVKPVSRFVPTGGIDNSVPIGDR